MCRNVILLRLRPYRALAVFSLLFGLALSLTPVTSLSQPACGVQRWPVKTGTDADVSMVDLNAPPTPTTISALSVIPEPIFRPQSNRIPPVETTVFVVNATLTSYSLEEDSDYHLVLSDPQGNTMIVEIPSPGCVGATSPFRAAIAQARANFDARFTATSTHRTANIPVRVTGVGFLDHIHGQTGVAPNGIELHPVLDIVFNPTPADSAITYQIAVLHAPVRSCPATTCSPIAQLGLGDLVSVIEVVPGESFEGNTDWLHIQINGVDGYIHGVLARPTEMEPISTPTPQFTPTATHWVCTGDLFNCSSFSTCDEVMSYFDTCPGDPSRLDPDHDGMPCESCSR